MTKGAAVAHLSTSDEKLVPNQTKMVDQKLEGTFIIETDLPQDMTINVFGPTATITNTAGYARKIPLNAKNYMLIIQSNDLQLVPVP